MRVVTLFCACIMLLLAADSLADKPPESMEVKAKLIEIPGKLPPDDLYDYAYVMKYQVIGGQLDKKIIYVAHYKPLRSRRKASKDSKVKGIVKGNLKRFKTGAIHMLRLHPEVKKIWKGAVIDEYFARDRKSRRYWSLQVNSAPKK